MNKKTLGLLAVVCLSGVTGCGAKTYSVGLGYSASFKAGQLDVTTAVAAFDKDGKVYDVRFDVVQVKFTANEAKDGLTLTNKNVDVNGSVTTKLELGLGYNMLNSSAIKKECDEQIEAFADWCVGKTAEEVKAGTPGAGHGEAVNEELASSVTITVDAFEEALANAFATKSETTFKLTGTAGVAMVSGLAYNYGKPTKEISVNVGGAFVKDGKIEAALMDEIVCPVAIAEDGTTSLGSGKYVKDGALVSKKTLGDDYAMRPASPIKAEWDEQAAVIEEAVIGLTASEVTALEAGKDSLAGATMTVNSYLAAIAKAATYAEKEVIAAR